MGLCSVELSEDLRRVNTLLTQLQYSRITAQELTDGELRTRLTESLTEAIGALRKGQEEVRLGLLRSIVTSADIRMHTGAGRDQFIFTIGPSEEHSARAKLKRQPHCLIASELIYLSC